MKNKKYYGISRIDSKHTHGWYVRVYANGGVFTSKLFSDRLYGGKQTALNNAIKFRDHNKMVSELHKRQGRNPNRPVYYTKPPKNNSSGIVGVNEVTTKINGKPVHYFQATWSEDGRPMSQKFYISKKRDKDTAFKQAVKLRRQKEKEMQKSWEKQIKSDEKEMEKVKKIAQKEKRKHAK